MGLLAAFDNLKLYSVDTKSLTLMMMALSVLFESQSSPLDLILIFPMLMGKIVGFC